MKEQKNKCPVCGEEQENWDLAIGEPELMNAIETGEKTKKEEKSRRLKNPEDVDTEIRWNLRGSGDGSYNTERSDGSAEERGRDIKKEEKGNKEQNQESLKGIESINYIYQRAV